MVEVKKVHTVLQSKFSAVWLLAVFIHRLIRKLGAAGLSNGLAMD